MADFLEAPAVSRAQLEAVAQKFRAMTGCAEDPWFPADRIVEHTLTAMLGPNYVLDILPAAQMGGRHGFAVVSEKRLVLRDDVYDGLVAGRGRDRMTAVHEVAHFILHPDRVLSRRMTATPPPAYRCPEWQAKCLAGAIMMPAPMMVGMTSVRAMAAEFGVSPDAAAYRAKQLRMEVGR